MRISWVCTLSSNYVNIQSSENTSGIVYKLTCGLLVCSVAVLLPLLMSVLLPLMKCTVFFFIPNTALLSLLFCLHPPVMHYMAKGLWTPDHHTHM